MRWAGLAAFPTTQFRILVSIFLATMYVIVQMVGSMAFLPPREIPDGIGYFILAMMIPDAVQFTVKRMTHKNVGDTAVDQDEEINSAQAQPPQ